MSKNELKSNIDEQPISLVEHLSSVLDDEAGSFEQRRVLDELTSGDKQGDSSQELSQKLSRFALIGESMRSTNPTAVAGSNFLEGIHEQIALEDEYQNIQVPSVDHTNDAVIPLQTSQQSWLRPIGGFALVASLAAVAVMGLQNYQLNNQLEAQSKTIIAMQASVKEAQTVVTASSVDEVMVASIDDNPHKGKNKKANKSQEQEYQQANVHARSFLKRYIDSHVQYASRSTFVPSVRVIAYADY